jgi:hypothetical protein
MTGPVFKKVTNQTPGNAAKYGAQDIVYAFNVLDGTHPTDRIQASVVEGLIFSYDVLVYVSGTTIYARRANGTLVASGVFGTDDKTVIQAAFDVAIGSIPTFLVIRPGTYTINGSLTLRTTLRIRAYGVTFLCSGGTAGFNVFIANTTGTKSDIKIQGLTINFNNNAGSAKWEGTDTGTQQVNNVTLQDCVFKNPNPGSNMLNFTYTFPAAGAGQPTKKNTNIRIINCDFDGTGGTGVGNLVIIENTTNAFINGCRFRNTQSTKTAALLLSGTCENCEVFANSFSDNNDAIADLQIEQCTNIRVYANDIATRVTVVDSRFVAVNGNRLRLLRIADKDLATYESGARDSIWRGTQYLQVGNNFFNALSINAGGQTLGVTTDKNIIFDLAGTTTNPPKRIAITGNHVVSNRMFIDFVNATTSGNPGVIENLYISSNSIVQNSGTNAGSTADRGIIRIGAASNWTSAGFKDVVIEGNYFAPTDQSTIPNDITLVATGFANVVIRDNVFNNAGVSNVNSYVSGISRNYGTTTATRFSNSGTVSGSTSPITVTHDVSYTPTAQNISVTPTTTWGSMTKFWTSNYTTTTFDINMSPAPGQSVSFAWQVSRRGG